MLLLGGRANTIRRCLQSECGKHVPHRRPTQEQRKREPSASASVGEQEGGDEPGRGRRWSAPAHRLIAHAPARLTRRLRRFLLCGQGPLETASTALPLRPGERIVVLVWTLLPVEGPPCNLPGLPGPRRVGWFRGLLLLLPRIWGSRGSRRPLVAVAVAFVVGTVLAGWNWWRCPL